MVKAVGKKVLLFHAGAETPQLSWWQDFILIREEE